MSILTSNVFTYVLTNTTLEIQNSNIRAISINCTTNTSGSVLGAGKLLNSAGSLLSSAAITVAQGSPVTITTQTDGITYLLITAPASCTLEIIAIML